MDFFVSWYQGDAIYPLYDDNCSLLISITSVSRAWTIRSLPKLPQRLLIDSGGYRLGMVSSTPHQLASSPQWNIWQKHVFTEKYLTQKMSLLSPQRALERQLSLLDGIVIPTIVCALDCPILDVSLNWVEKDQCITQTIAFANELKSLIAQKDLAEYITPMAIIQGYDIDSLKYCAYELASIGFPLYGIGSLAPLKQHNLIMERVQAVASIIDAKKLHIFGVSAIQTVQALQKMGVHSIDSSRPAKAAAYNEILYSSPYQRFGILELSTSEEEPLKGRIPRVKRLSTPLACSCPICLEDPIRIMGIGRRSNIRDRGVHNYYHLKRLFFGDEG